MAFNQHPNLPPYYEDPKERPLQIHFDGQHVHMSVAGETQRFCASILREIPVDTPALSSEDVVA